MSNGTTIGQLLAAGPQSVLTTAGQGEEPEGAIQVLSLFPPARIPDIVLCNMSQYSTLPSYQTNKAQVLLFRAVVDPTSVLIIAVISHVQYQKAPKEDLGVQI